MTYNRIGVNEVEQKFSTARQDMVRNQLQQRGITDPRLLEAFRAVPREMFIPATHQHLAYDDAALPIGFGQTISQPYVVALMLRELDTFPKARVLDVGAGSGYQTALLAQLCGAVFAIEMLDELTERAMCVLQCLNVSNVSFRTGDGSVGWQEEAPFDRIICGAGAPDVPASWVSQLADGGRIVVPTGSQEQQRIQVIQKRGEQIVQRELGDVRFVPLVGKEGWQAK